MKYGVSIEHECMRVYMYECMNVCMYACMHLKPKQLKKPDKLCKQRQGNPNKVIGRQTIMLHC